LYITGQDCYGKEITAKVAKLMKEISIIICHNHIWWIEYSYSQTNFFFQITRTMLKEKLVPLTLICVYNTRKEVGLESWVQYYSIKLFFVGTKLFFVKVYMHMDSITCSFKFIDEKGRRLFIDEKGGRLQGIAMWKEVLINCIASYYN